MIKYDVIIPVSYTDSLFLPKSLPYISENLVGIDKIYIITKSCYLNRLKHKLNNYENVVLLDEDSLIDNLSFNSIKELLVKRYGYPLRTGWYFQQFLKLGFSRSKYSSKYYLSWDADTLPLRKMEFEENGHLLFNPKSEYNKPYFDTLYRLLGLERKVGFSFISEHMIFDKDIVNIMLDDIEHNHPENTNWMSAIIDSTELSTSNGIVEMFSEFETYGNYCWQYYPNYYKARHLNTFRYGGYIRGRFLCVKALKKMSVDVDTISFEMQHEPPFPWKILVRIYKYWIKFRQKL